MKTENLDQFLSNPSVHPSSEEQLRAAQLELAAFKLWAHTAQEEIDHLTQQLAEEKVMGAVSDRWIEEIWNALGLKTYEDWDTNEKAMERIRDLVAAEGELGDLREQLKQGRRDDDGGARDMM